MKNSVYFIYTCLLDHFDDLNPFFHSEKLMASDNLLSDLNQNKIYDQHQLKKGSPITHEVGGMVLFSCEIMEGHHFCIVIYDS